MILVLVQDGCLVHVFFCRCFNSNAWYTSYVRACFTSLRGKPHAAILLTAFSSKYFLAAMKFRNFRFSVNYQGRGTRPALLTYRPARIMLQFEYFFYCCCQNQCCTRCAILLILIPRTAVGVKYAAVGDWSFVSSRPKLNIYRYMYTTLVQ